MKGTQREQQAYARKVNRHKPRPPIFRNAVTAFVTGGIITAMGQVVMNWFSAGGLPQTESAGATAAVMISVGAVLTGFGLYDRLGRWGGMGAALPITGFANAIVAPAMEHKREGYVLGVGARMFTIAGPVIVYAVLVAVASAGVVFWFQKGP